MTTHIKLTENEAEILLGSARSGQKRLRNLLEMLADLADVTDASDQVHIRHYQAMYSRAENVIQTLEKRITFPESP